jgi:hypothetical protein
VGQGRLVLRHGATVRFPFCRMKTAPTNAALLALSAGVACVALLVAPGCNGSLAPGTPRGADGGSSSLNPDASVSPGDASASTGIDGASAGIDSASPADATVPSIDSASQGLDSASPDDAGAPDIDSALPGDASASAGMDSEADSGPVSPTIQGCPATQLVDLSTANGRILVPACNAGYAHPNICCRASPTQVTECADCRGAPFAACDNASLTFPDPGRCCSLGDGGCAEASVLSVDPGDAAIELSCYYACGPGGYSPHELQSPTARACSDVADSSDPVCYYCCLGGGCVSNQCSCGACPPSGCGGDNCGACPAGWNVPAGGQYDLCCQIDSSGAARCFSQAGSITYSP